MPRQARFTIDNGTYHVMTRGNNRKRIFESGEDYRHYLTLLKENKKKYNIKLYHYALMDNHVHLMINAPKGKNLSGAMKRLNIQYMKYYQKKYDWTGSFFHDRFKSFVIQDGNYLLECGRYIELNPVQAGFVNHAEEYDWSSYKVYAEDQPDDFIDINPEYKGLSPDKDKRKKLYKDFIKDGINWERRKEERFFKTGAYGSKEYIKELKDQGLKTVWSHVGRPRKK